MPDTNKSTRERFSAYLKEAVEEYPNVIDLLTDERKDPQYLSRRAKKARRNRRVKTASAVAVLMLVGTVIASMYYKPEPVDADKAPLINIYAPGSGFAEWRPNGVPAEGSDGDAPIHFQRIETYDWETIQRSAPKAKEPAPPSGYAFERAELIHYKNKKIDIKFIYSAPGKDDIEIVQKNVGE